MLAVDAIPILADNYVWLLHAAGRALVVDPGDAAPVERALQARGLQLAGILVTHHHHDHIGGIDDLLARHEVPVFGPRSELQRIPRLSVLLDDGDCADTPLGRFSVMAVPGHTRGHIAFVGDGRVFCGDTLFSAGCGRMFEGTPAQFHASLDALAALPDDTAVHCTHEYTQANLAFARHVTPDDAAVADYAAEIARRREQGHPSLPSTIGRERRINPFLRCGEPRIAERAALLAGTPLASSVEVFAALRSAKDGFRG